MIDEERGLYLARLAMTSDQSALVDLPIRSLWLILGALQMTITHPGLHEPLKLACTAVGKQVQEIIVAALPEVEELAEAGWDREQDWIGWDEEDADDDDYFDAEAYGNKDISDDLGYDDDDYSAMADLEDDFDAEGYSNKDISDDLGDLEVKN